MAVDIVEALGEHTDVAGETAFRHAAETWMQSNNMIRVTQNGEVLPLFLPFSVPLTPGRGMLLQAGDGGMAGAWELGTDGQPTMWDTITAPMPGWILRGIDQ